MPQVCKPQIKRRVWKGWMGTGFSQAFYRTFILSFLEIQPSQVIGNARLLADRLPHSFKFLARLGGLVLLKERYTKGESRPHGQPWVNCQRRAKLFFSRFVLFLL